MRQLSFGLNINFDRDGGVHPGELGTVAPAG